MTNKKPLKKFTPKQTTVPQTRHMAGVLHSPVTLKGHLLKKLNLTFLQDYSDLNNRQPKKFTIVVSIDLIPLSKSCFSYNGVYKAFLLLSSCDVIVSQKSFNGEGK